MKREASGMTEGDSALKASVVLSGSGKGPSS